MSNGGSMPIKDDRQPVDEWEVIATAIGDEVKAEQCGAALRFYDLLLEDPLDVGALRAASTAASRESWGDYIRVAEHARAIPDAGWSSAVPEVNGMPGMYAVRCFAGIDQPYTRTLTADGPAASFVVAQDDDGNWRVHGYVPGN